MMTDVELTLVFGGIALIAVGIGVMTWTLWTAGKL
jgi:hypothetical protein